MRKQIQSTPSNHHPAAGHYDPSFRLALCLKVLTLIDDLIKQTGTRPELAQAAYARFRAATARCGQAADEMSVCRLIEENAGVELRVAADWIAPWEMTHPDETAPALPTGERTEDAT